VCDAVSILLSGTQCLLDAYWLAKCDPSERMWPCQHLDFGLLSSRIVREWISVVLSIKFQVRWGLTCKALNTEPDTCRMFIHQGWIQHLKIWRVSNCIFQIERFPFCISSQLCTEENKARISTWLGYCFLLTSSPPMGAKWQNVCASPCGCLLCSSFMFGMLTS
jgi:hypothetical protein